MLVQIGLLVIVCIYLQIVICRDKKRFKEWQRIQKTIEKENRRRAREEKLKNQRINHPKVVYLADYRRQAYLPPSG